MKLINWHNEVKIVLGYNRACIYDLSREEYYLAPKEIITLIEKIKGKELNVILSYCDEVEREWLQFLFKNEFIFEIDEEVFNCFDKIDSDWKSPSVIENVIIEFGLEGIIDYINYFNVKKAIIWITREVSLDELRRYISNNFTGSTIQNIELLFECMNYPDIDNLRSENPLVDGFFVPKKTGNYISPMFICNANFYRESLQFNTYLNKKLFLAQNGNYSNSSFSEVLGNLFEIDIESSRDFVKKMVSTEYWYAKKDNCLVCSRCEFRYMCYVDDLPLLSNDNQWRYPRECAYNPFISKWRGESGYKSLKESGVFLSENGINIDKKKLSETNQILWDYEG